MFLQRCPLCAYDIDPGTKDWRMCYQEFTIQNGSANVAQFLPLPSDYPPQSFEVRVHDSCWKIACHSDSILNFGLSEFLRFKQCMLDLAPLQTSLSSSDSPNESKRLNALGRRSSGRRPTLGTLHCLPIELLYLVFENIPSIQDADCFIQATGVDFPTSLYQGLCQEAFGVTLDIDKPGCVSQSLCHSPSLLNRSIVWGNVKRILKHMGRPFHGDDSTTVPRTFDLTWPPLTAIRQANILPMTGQQPPVQFHFSCFGSKSYLTGVGLNGHLVGYQGDQVYTGILQAPLSGLRLVYNEIGIIMVQVQSGVGWGARIGGQDNNAKKDGGVFFSEYCGLAGGYLLGHFDSVKLTGIAASTDGRADLPLVWGSRTSFCNLRVQPMIVPTIPYTWDVLYLRNDVTALSFFVFDTDQVIVGVEAQYSDGTVSRIGLDDDSVVKLTLFLSVGGIYSSHADDTIQRVRAGRSNNNGALALELCTSNRLFTVGTVMDDLVHFEFPAALIFAFSHDGRPMPCVVGIALPGEGSAEHRPCHPKSQPIHSINFNPEPRNPCDVLFFSKAALLDIVGIAAYSGSDPPEDICGMVFAYQSSPPFVLGQARKKYGSYQKLGSDNVREIFVYYKPYMFGRRVAGVRFFLWSSHKLSFGDCSRPEPEILRVSEDTDELVFGGSVRPTQNWRCDRVEAINRLLRCIDLGLDLT